MTSKLSDKIIEFLSAHPDGYAEAELKGSMDAALWRTLAEERGNLIEWLPIRKNERVLELGAHFGELTGVLLRKGAFIDAIESSEDGRGVLTERYGGLPSYRLFAEPQEVFSERRSLYDWIIIPDGLQNETAYRHSLRLGARGGRSGDAESRLLLLINELKEHLTPSGRIVFVTENLFGLKQLSAPDRKNGEYFSQLTGDYGGRGQLLFSRRQLKSVFDRAMLRCSFYYPFPDAYFPEYIFSDDRLPMGGELTLNAMSDPQGIRLFDDGGAWRAIVGEGLFAELSSVFLCVLTSASAPDTPADYPMYVKYSVRRQVPFRICTELRVDAAGERFIRKRAYDREAAPHVGRMGMIYRRLSDCLSGQTVSPCPMVDEEPDALIPYGAVRLSYMSGEPLDRLLDCAMEEGRLEDIYSLLDNVHDMLTRQARVPFRPASRFLTLFGLEEETALEEFTGEASLAVTDIDLIPANIFYDEDSQRIIDYEWTIEDPVPLGFLWYRFLHYYVETRPDRREYFGRTLYRRYDISEERETLYQWMEESFQQFVKGDREPLYVELARIAEPERTLSELVTASRRLAADTQAEVFSYSGGAYHRVEDSALEVRTFPGQICSYEVRVSVDAGSEQIRLDPADAPGILLVESVTDQDGNRLAFSTNGCKKLSSGGVLYDTDDPMLMVAVTEKVTLVAIRYQYDILTADEDALGGRAGEKRRARLLQQRIRCAAGTEKIASVSNTFIFKQVRRSLYEDNILFVWGHYPYENEGGAGLTVELDGQRLDCEVVTSPVRLGYDDIPHEDMLDLKIRLPENYRESRELAIYSGSGERRTRVAAIPADSFKARLLYRVDGLVEREDSVIILGYAAGFGEVSISVSDGNGGGEGASIRRVSRFDINQEVAELSRDAKVGFEIRLPRPTDGLLYPIRMLFSVGDERAEHIINESDFAEAPAPSAWQKLMHYGRRSVEVMQSDGLGEVIRKARKKLSSRQRETRSEYEQWLDRHTPGAEEYERQRRESPRLAGQPRFSIVVPVYHTDSDQLKALIESVIAQTYGGWELCLADGGSEGGQQSTLTQLVGAYSQSEPRIRYEILPENGGIAENTNAAIRMSTGDYIVLLDHDDLIEPDTLYECARRISDDPTVEVLYSDQDMIDADGAHRFSPVMKPDFSIDFLRTRNYISHIFVAKRTLLDEVGLLNSEFDGSQDYDLILRCAEKARTIVHIPRVLYHWRTAAASTADDPGEKTYAYEAGQRALEAHYKRLGIDASVEMTEVYGVYRTTYHYPTQPLVSVIIPNKDHRDDLSRCVNSILEKERYPSYEIIIVENGSGQPDIFDYYERISDDPRVRVVNYEGDFNFSAINNFGAGEARGEYLLFLNNDTEEIDGGLITELMNYGQREDVGVVGARLYYEDETIQHAGLIIGYSGLAGHAFLGFDRTRYGSLDRIICAQNYSAVTAACMLTRAEIFKSVGGFSEELAVAYNDVDYCLRVRRQGKLVVYTPYAIAYHYESRSRGYEDTPEKRARYEDEAQIFRGRWRHIIEAGDPYYNPNLALDKDDFSLRD